MVRPVYIRPLPLGDDRIQFREPLTPRDVRAHTLERGLLEHLVSLAQEAAWPAAAGHTLTLSKATRLKLAHTVHRPTTVDASEVAPPGSKGTRALLCRATQANHLG